MVTIEVSHLDRKQFLLYISIHLDACVDHNITRFGIEIDNDEKPLILPSFGEFDWKYEGETFTVKYSEEGDPMDSHGGGPTYFQRLTVGHADIKLLKQFVSHALKFTKPVDKQKIKLFYAKSRGYWEHFNTIYAQTVEKIFLDQDLKKSILCHIDSFVKNQDKYIKYGRPHKLNFLFAGVPGSGKSSLVKALAMKYKRPLYIMNFSKNMTDETLVDLISEIKDNSILLLEDIDAFFVDRKAVDINISFSGLINTLDGALNKGNGIITIMTANNADRLDPALIRPGRVDKIICFDYPKKQEIKDAFLDLTDNATNFDQFYQKIKHIRISMSGIIDYLFRNPIDYMDGVDELLQSTQILQDILKDKSDKLYS